MTIAYLDASALVKLAIAEPESHALERELRAVDVRITSVVGRIELERAVRRHDPDTAEGRLDDVRSWLTVIPLDVAIAAFAGATRPATLRALDAIHLATAVAAADDIDAFYCYDRRLAEAAEERGFVVRAPR